MPGACAPPGGEGTVSGGSWSLGPPEQNHLCLIESIEGIENIKKHKSGSCSLYSERVEAQFIVLFIVRNAWLSWIVKSGAPLISVRPPSEQGLQARCARGREGQVVGARRLCRSSGDQAADLTSCICGQNCFWWAPDHCALLQETKWEEPHASLSLGGQLKPGQTSVHPGETGDCQDAPRMGTMRAQQTTTLKIDPERRQERIRDSVEDLQIED